MEFKSWLQKGKMENIVPALKRLQDKVEATSKGFAELATAQGREFHAEVAALNQTVNTKIEALGKTVHEEVDTLGEK